MQQPAFSASAETDESSALGCAGAGCDGPASDASGALSACDASATSAKQRSGRRGWARKATSGSGSQCLAVAAAAALLGSTKSLASPLCRSSIGLMLQMARAARLHYSVGCDI